MSSTSALANTEDKDLNPTPSQFNIIINSNDRTAYNRFQTLSKIFVHCSNEYDVETGGYKKGGTDVSFMSDKIHNEKFVTAIKSHPLFESFRVEFADLCETFPQLTLDDKSEVHLADEDKSTPLTRVAIQASRYKNCGSNTSKQDSSTTATSTKNNCGLAYCAGLCLWIDYHKYSLEGMETLYIVYEKEANKVSRALDYTREYIKLPGRYFVDGEPVILFFVRTRDFYTDSNIDYEDELIELYIEKYPVQTTDDKEILIDGIEYNQSIFFDVYNLNDQGGRLRVGRRQATDEDVQIKKELPILESLGLDATPEQIARLDELTIMKEEVEAEKNGKKKTEQTDTISVHGVQAIYTNDRQGSNITVEQGDSIAQHNTRTYRNEILGGRPFPIISDNQLTINSTYAHNFIRLTGTFANSAIDLGYQVKGITQSNTRLKMKNINSDVEGSNFQLFTADEIIANFKSAMTELGKSTTNVRYSAAETKILKVLMISANDIGIKGHFGYKVKDDNGKTTEITYEFDYDAFIDLCHDPKKYITERLKL